MTSFKPCPDKPNCVSSQAEDARHSISPLAVKKSSDWPKSVIDVLSSVRGITVTDVNDDYIHAECRSLIFRFVDDLELLWDSRKSICQVRSASRVGHSDLGVNRRRVEKIRKLLQKIQ